MAGTRIIEAKFSRHGTVPLHRKEWRRLQAFLALERGAALAFVGAGAS